MFDFFEAHPWKIIENELRPDHKRFSESIFSLGNEHMGLRGFFEEDYSGDTFQGSYIAGVYYPDPTKVGWWKNGYPEFFAKVINSTNWVGMHVCIDGERLDPAQGQVSDYRAELDMKQGLLSRSYVWTSPCGKKISVSFQRFLSMSDVELGAVRCEIKALSGPTSIVVTPYLDGDVRNLDSNYGEKFWDAAGHGAQEDALYLKSVSKKTHFEVAHAMSCRFLHRHEEHDLLPQSCSQPHRAEAAYAVGLAENETMTLEKFVAVLSSRDHDAGDLIDLACEKVQKAREVGFDQLFAHHVAVWDQKWSEADVIIEGDVKAQQGIRYNIFQLQQTYAGRDSRLNIGPKGFTGEKYGGCTYWDTEAFCFPFYLYTNKEVARNLLVYRYNHLERAKENARKLQLKGALYPMVTIDGRECHNEWEITFEEIHRNGAIAYAIYHYTEFTGDTEYLDTMGLEVLIELSRFWASRVSYSEPRKKFVILGVTGPNEYENNVNNNYYTNMLAQWTLGYTLQELDRLERTQKDAFKSLQDRTQLTRHEELQWLNIQQKMYLPRDEERRIYLQQDGYLDKEQKLVSDLQPGDYPLHKNWSWDHILRSPYIKQADTIQAFYFFPKLIDRAELRRTFDFYEPRTVHESSLSPSVYSIVASMAGYEEKAYELYLRTARLDLDNYNHDTEDGCHITSMVGSWLAIVQGFAGLRFEGNQLAFDPYLPQQWSGYSFKINYQNRPLSITVSPGEFVLQQLSGEPMTVKVGAKSFPLSPAQAVLVPTRRSDA
jgi:maltose phosphorylase